MPEITKQTLAFAIFAMAYDRCRLIDRINRSEPGNDDEEHLPETLMDMDRSLGELGDLYAAYGDEMNGFDFDTLYANAEQEYQQDCEARCKS